MAEKKAPVSTKGLSKKSTSKNKPPPSSEKMQSVSMSMNQIVKPAVMVESEDKKYDRMKLMIPARHDKRFGMGVINSKGKVFVSTITPNSIAFDYFEPKDRLIAINGVQITDKTHCKQLILNACSSAPEFEIVVERLKKEISGGASKPKTAAEPEKSPPEPAKSTPEVAEEIPDLSYCRPFKDTDAVKGNPLDGFQTAPADVREILKLRTKSIVADFMPPYRRNVTKGKTDKAQFNFAEEAHLTQIASDVPMDKQLMKPRK